VAIPIADPDIPLLNAVIPLFLSLSVEIILSTLKNKSQRLKNSFEGKPSYIIYKGRLLQKELSDNRISINELLSELRCQGIGDICEVEYAIIEQNGSLSVIKKQQNNMSHPIIIDGELIPDTLASEGKDKKWLHSVLKKNHVSEEDVFLMTITDDEQVHITKKENVK
jgi:uncharacterized membrane protein YcaP (DUF421 family)